MDTGLHLLLDDPLLDGSPPELLEPPSRRSLCANETLNRYYAVQLMALGLCNSDIRKLCDVPSSFLRRTSPDLHLMPPWLLGQATAVPEQRRQGGNAPGVWSLCYRPTTRLEAAMFAIDWALAGLPFTSRPHPAALLWAYKRYQHWNWHDEDRHLLDPSSCLSVLRLVHDSELDLARCLLCKQLFVHPAAQSQVITSEACPFCGSPHRQNSHLDAEHRVLQSH